MVFGAEWRIHNSERPLRRGRPQQDTQRTLGRIASIPVTGHKPSAAWPTKLTVKGPLRSETCHAAYGTNSAISDHRYVAHSSPLHDPGSSNPFCRRGMNLTRPFSLPLWTVAGPIAACAVLGTVWDRPLGGLVAFGVAVALIVSVTVAVQHAETVAHRVGEPFGALILALAVTVIEVSLIVSLKIFGGAGKDALARDTVFATVMIVCNGVVGLCLLAGALRNHVAVFRVEGSSPALAVLMPLTTLSLVLPQFTTTTTGPTYSNIQLVFAGLMSLLLFGVYVFVQTIRHREHFLPGNIQGDTHDEHGEPPAYSTAMAAFALLCVALVAVIGLAKVLAPSIEVVVKAIGAPSSFVGVIIALIVLLPETGAAFRAAIRNRMQISLNLALGSALATIGLTIPAVGFLAIGLDMPITLGLPPKEIVLLFLTFAVSTITLASGRATVLHGTVHLVVFAAFLFLSIVP